MYSPFSDAKRHCSEACRWLVTVREPESSSDVTLEEIIEAAVSSLCKAEDILREAGFETRERGYDDVAEMPMYEAVIVYPEAAAAARSIARMSATLQTLHSVLDILMVMTHVETYFDKHHARVLEAEAANQPDLDEPSY